MITPKFPNQRKIVAMIKKVEAICNLKSINSPENSQIKEGLKFCWYLLRERIDYPENDFRIPETEAEISEVDKIYKSQLQWINTLHSIEARALAILCVDWLNGQNDGTWIKIKLK